MIYWILNILIAAIAYFFGCLDSTVIASNFVFRRNLARLGSGNVGLSNFRRVFGMKGFVKLLLVELVLDILPILIGGWLLGIKEHMPVGRALAGFCFVMGRLYPAIYELKGRRGLIALLVTALFTDTSLGIVALIVAVAVILFTRYLSLGTVAAAFATIVVALLVVDDRLCMLLTVFTAAVIIFRHIPAMLRLLNGKETRLSFEEDISYKFDQKF